MNRILYWIAMIWMATATTTSFAQSSGTTDATLVSAWTNYRGTHFDEKLFVHTDKEFYLSGELCWFKCYVVSGLTHKPLSISKVAYVELLDTANKPVLQAKIAIDSGSGSGNLYMPFSLPSGVYTLRAYTRWMKNSPAAYFYSKAITVVNTREPAPDASMIRADSSPVLALFPEGGNLVAGLPSTIAFRGTDTYGRPLEFTGYILNEKGDTVVNFSPSAMGSGRFSLTPENGHTYSAVMDFTTTTRAPAPGDNLYSSLYHTAPIPITISLPKVYAQGYVMHLDTSGNRQLRVVVSASTSQNGSVFLFVQTRGSLKLAQAQNLQNGQATFLVDPQVLGPGISHLTVFNAEHQPVCERLYFKPPPAQTDLQVKALKTDFNPRDPVDIGIETGAKKADLSMTVYRLDSLQHESGENIVNYLWLTSDLGSDAPNPTWYYDHPDHVDDLMLTLGWRRFQWDSVLSNHQSYFAYAPEYGGHVITGTVVDTRTGKPAAEKDAFLSVPGKWTQFATSESDSSGKVAWDFTNMYGSAEIVVQTDLGRDSLYRVDVDDPFSLEYVPRQSRTFQLPLHNPRTISALNMSMQIQNAYVAMDHQAWTWPALDSTPFYFRADEVYKLDDFTRFTTIEEVLREYVQLVNVSLRKNHFHIWTYDDPHKEPFLDDPLVLLDGVPIFNLDTFFKYDPFKIRKVEVLTRRYIIGQDAFDGVVSWTTYKGDLNGYNLDVHATAVDYEGLEAKREFYSPNYGGKDLKASRLPDYRNVLYWDPHLHTQAGVSRKVRFYTSDLPGTYIVIVQGIGENGEPLYGKALLNVDEP